MVVCGSKMTEAEPAVAGKFLKMYIQQVHGVTSKPEKPKRPELTMSWDALEATDFDRFTFLFQKYKKTAGAA